MSLSNTPAQNLFAPLSVFPTKQSQSEEIDYSSVTYSAPDGTKAKKTTLSGRGLVVTHSLVAITFLVLGIFVGKKIFAS